MPASRLGPGLLKTVTPDISVPCYDRNQPVGVVHLGVGAFHRAHQAVYFDRLMSDGETGWMITGASLRRANVANDLNPQNGLFCVRVTDDTHDTTRIIGSVKNVIVAKHQTAELIAQLAAPETQLVTLTVTEKGYHVNLATRSLNEESADIQHDIHNLYAPITAPGFLVAGLQARKAASLAPFTVLSCDNLPCNGDITRIAVLSLANLVSPELARWIDTHGAFPSSMVDRIVPAVSDTDVDDLAGITGWRDQAMVKTEPFSQWVIEDKFCSERPPLQRVGVQFTDDVGAWETVKLRMLNGAHSALAYMGSLAGHEYVNEAVATPEFQTFIPALWDEIEATLPVIPGFSAKEYRRDLMARFQNSTLKHRTHQIAMDGSQKIPQRILAPLRDRHDLGLASPALMRVLAAWIRYQTGIDNHGQAFTVHDPMGDILGKIATAAGDNTDALLDGVTALESVFGQTFETDASLMTALKHAFYDSVPSTTA